VRVDARQEEQFDHNQAFPLAARAVALGDAEREAAGILAAFSGFGGRREQRADMVEQASVGGEGKQ